MFRCPPRISAVAAAIALAWPAAQADVVTDWNVKANELIVAGKVGPLPGNRVMAIAHVAAFEAVNAITGRYPASAQVVLDAGPGASVDAAVAAAMRGTLGKLLVPQLAEVDAAYQSALASVPDGTAKSAGIAVGEKAAGAVLAKRVADGAAAPDSYLPFAVPGTYVPTASPVGVHWGKRTPWVLTSGAQLRPGAPPALGSEVWARDYNEVKALGGKNSSQRSAAFRWHAPWHCSPGAT
jgi:hypothetical protein